MVVGLKIYRIKKMAVGAQFPSTSDVTTVVLGQNLNHEITYVADLGASTVLNADNAPGFQNTWEELWLEIRKILLFTDKVGIVYYGQGAILAVSFKQDQNSFTKLGFRQVQDIYNKGTHTKISYLTPRAGGSTIKEYTLYDNFKIARSQDTGLANIESLIYLASDGKAQAILIGTNVNVDAGDNPIGPSGSV